MPLGKRLHDHEADIVPIGGVLGARIAEPDKELHGSGTKEIPGHATHGRDRSA
jgi:hypothetical protein